MKFILILLIFEILFISAIIIVYLLLKKLIAYIILGYQANKYINEAKKIIYMEGTKKKEEK